MRMLGAKNTRVLLRIFMIRKTMVVREYSWTHLAEFTQTYPFRPLSNFHSQESSSIAIYFHFN